MLQGHLSEVGTIVDGALAAPAASAVRPLSVMLNHFVVDAAARIALHRGVMPVRLNLKVDRGGTVSECSVLSDRVLHSDPGNIDWHCLGEDLVCRFLALSFPSAAGESVIIQPVVFGQKSKRFSDAHWRTKGAGRSGRNPSRFSDISLRGDQT